MPAISGWQYVHELVAEAFIGPRPSGMVVDHIDRNPRNNAPSNLRYVSVADNTRNSKLRKRALSPRLGVYPYRARWRAQIWDGKRAVHLGVFATVDEAEAVFLAERRRLFPAA